MVHNARTGIHFQQGRNVHRTDLENAKKKKKKKEKKKIFIFYEYICKMYVLADIK